MGDDSELEAIRQRRMAQLMAQHSGSTQAPVSAEDQQQQEEQRQAAEEQRRGILFAVMQPAARERLSRISLVKPDKARAVEDMLITAAKRGQIGEKVSEDRLIDLLEQVNERMQAKTKVTIQLLARFFLEDVSGQPRSYLSEMRCISAIMVSASVMLSSAAPAPPPRSSWDYSALLSSVKYTGIQFDDLPGYTRSIYERNWALITPESHVFAGNPGWSNATTAHLISPAVGAHFSMYLCKMRASSASLPVTSEKIERFVFILDGVVLFTNDDEEEVWLHAGDFVYFPPKSTHTLISRKGAGLLVYERLCNLKNASQQVYHGSADDQPLLPTEGEIFRLRKLLPQTSAYDFNIHVMDFYPGEYLNVKEVHYNQHGMLLLAGKGIYRLGDVWMPVSAGDSIWMAPYVPQWFAALGTREARYILYKDTTIDPLMHV